MNLFPPTISQKSNGFEIQLSPYSIPAPLKQCLKKSHTLIGRIQFKFAITILSWGVKTSQKCPILFFVFLVESLSLFPECFTCFFPFKLHILYQIPSLSVRTHFSENSVRNVIFYQQIYQRMYNYPHTLSVLPHCCVWHISASDTNQILHSSSESHGFLFTQGLCAAIPLLSCIITFFMSIRALWISIQLCHEIWDLNK